MQGVSASFGQSSGNYRSLKSVIGTTTRPVGNTFRETFRDEPEDREEYLRE